MADKLLAKVVALVISTCAQRTLGAMSSGVLPKTTGEELASNYDAKYLAKGEHGGLI